MIVVLKNLCSFIDCQLEGHQKPMQVMSHKLQQAEGTPA